MRYLITAAVTAGALAATGTSAVAATGDPSHAVYVCGITAPPNIDPFFTGEKVVVLEQLQAQSLVRSAQRPTIQDFVANFCLGGFGSW